MRLNKADRLILISSIEAQMPTPPEKQKLDDLVRRTFVAKLPAPRDVMQRLKRVGYGKAKPAGKAVGASA